MGDTILTLLQALQLAALLPCLFLIGLLVLLTRPLSHAIVPVAFFIVLGTSFLPGLLIDTGSASVAEMVLLWITSLLPAFTFLLIVQLWRGGVPHWSYWLILALPIIGGSSTVYATFAIDEVCMADTCLQAENFRVLYQLFASSAIFLLLMAHISHVPASGVKHRYASHRYWVIIALILFGVLLIANDFFILKESITAKQHDIIALVLRIAFIYLVTTSLFRLFDTKPAKPPRETEYDQDVIQALDTAMREQHIYREMGLSRDSLAAKLDVSDKRLSVIINQVFQKNFNEYVNQFRVEEAKKRLADEDTAITIIAFEVGFSSIASFNRVFKSLTGMSPSAYRSAQTPPL